MILKTLLSLETSFGISTLFLAQGVLETGGKIITTELIESKAKRAIQNFQKAGVDDLIEVRVGDALETLKKSYGAYRFIVIRWLERFIPASFPNA